MKMRFNKNLFNRPLFYLALLIFLVFSQLSVAAPLTIVTTIKPLALIIEEIINEEESVEFLLPESASPHSYALRPSDLKKINQADLVVWVGAELELFLQKLLQGKPNTLTLLNVKEMELLSFSKEAHAHHHTENGGHTENDGHTENGGHHHASTIDPHIWLGPLQAKAIAKAVADALGEKFPENNPRYQLALQQFAAKVEKQVAMLKQHFAKQDKKGYVSFHDAYTYFEKTFGLAPLEYLTVNPERKPGAKTIINIHKALVQNKAACVFSEPQFNPSTVKSLVRGTRAQVFLIDPLAKEVPLRKNGYFEFLAALSESYLSCFRG